MKDAVATDVHGRLSSATRTESPSITDIIAKFHRIKEERFKPKENPYMNYNNNLAARFQRHSEPTMTKRPVSATQKMRAFMRDSAEPKRRASLPSILKPETPPSLEEDWIDTTTSKRLQERSRVIARRYSTSHVWHEYSKKDIKDLFRAGQRGSVSEVKPLVAKPTEEDDENSRGYLTGEELHDYYHMWERRKRPKLRLPRRLPPVHNCLDHISDEGSTRPRLFTL